MHLSKPTVPKSLKQVLNKERKESYLKQIRLLFLFVDIIRVL